RADGAGAGHSPHSALPATRLALAGAGLPLLALLFQLRRGSGAPSRRRAGLVARHAAPDAMPSAGWARRGSGSVEGMALDRRTLFLVALLLALFLAYPFILRFLGLGQYLGPPQRGAPDTSRVAVAETSKVAPTSLAPGLGQTQAPADSGARAERTI